MSRFKTVESLGYLNELKKYIKKNIQVLSNHGKLTK